jgi:hypothetical protein
MKLLLPQGIGDSLWALTKVQSLTKGMPAAITLNCSQPTFEQARALKFVERFDFVKSTNLVITDIHKDEVVSPEGYYNYIDDGPSDPFDYVMMPNGPLERGHRLDTWLPQFEINWKVAEHFQFKPEETEFARELHHELGDYCIFYCGPEPGNTHNGHNRGPLWTPDDWGKLADGVSALGLKIVVVGAPYDHSYYRHHVLPLMKQHHSLMHARDFIGQWEIAQTFAVVKRARFVVSYQSGIGIFASYMGVPTAIFWRPRGDSISPDYFLSFEESMASAWTPPVMLETGKHMPCIYTRHGPDYILSEVINRKW